MAHIHRSAIHTAAVVTRHLADDALSADAAGRAKVADDYFNAATVAAKFDDDCLDATNLENLIEDDAVTATVAANKFADDLFTAANLENFIEDDALSVTVMANKVAADAVVPVMVDKGAAQDWDFSAASSFSVPAPTLGVHAVTKTYADALISGFTVKSPVRGGTTAALPAYTRVGNVITEDAVGAGINPLDGLTLVNGDRILLKDGAAGADNGIYVVTDIGSGAAVFVLTRASDYDTDAEVGTGDSVFISEGTANADDTYVLTTNEPITLNTTALTFEKFSGLGQVTAGQNLTKTGDQLDVTITTGRMLSGDNTGVAQEHDVGATLYGLPYGSGGGAVLVGTVQDHGASTSTGTAPGASDSGVASITVGGNADSDTASITVGGNADSGTASITVGGNADSGTASITVSDSVRFERFTNPIAPANVIAQKGADFNENTWGNITQPGTSDSGRSGRNIQCVFSGTWDGGNIRATGLRVDGSLGSEDITASAGSTVQGAAGWLYLTQIENLGSWSAGTVDVQVGLSLAVPVSGTPSLIVTKELSVGTVMAASSISMAGLVSITDAPANGARDYLIGYSCTQSATDAGHTHGSTALTATDAGHTHGSTALTATDAGHTHGSTALTATDAGHTHAHTATHTHDVTPPAHTIA